MDVNKLYKMIAMHAMNELEKINPECRYCYIGTCFNEDMTCYGKICPFETIDKCPVHNPEVDNETIIINKRKH